MGLYYVHCFFFFLFLTLLGSAHIFPVANILLSNKVTILCRKWAREISWVLPKSSQFWFCTIRGQNVFKYHDPSCGKKRLLSWKRVYATLKLKSNEIKFFVDLYSKIKHYSIYLTAYKWPSRKQYFSSSSGEWRKECILEKITLVLFYNKVNLRITQPIRVVT